jgi:CheY-like chemotaxis protein
MHELADGDWLERLYTEFTVAPVVILLASRPELADSARLRQLGVRRVLLKPINHTSLKITLAEELSYVGPAPSNGRRLEQSPLRCLVAEDNVINTKVLVGMLQKLGVDCTAVGNGQEAVEACQRQDYDIVLMDCDMPIMDGWEATRRIREIHNNRGRLPTPIIALTANTIAELGERARQPLMDAHLVKPIHLLELQALLERWTGRTLHARALVPGNPDALGAAPSTL